MLSLFSENIIFVIRSCFFQTKQLQTRYLALFKKFRLFETEQTAQVECYCHLWNTYMYEYVIFAYNITTFKNKS